MHLQFDEISEDSFLFWKKDFQSPHSRHKKFNEWFGMFSSYPEKVS
jgi:hypothetical protein